ncbi:MAG: vanadium-dependent haloperoxidase [Cyclobacteriaceae bacterium]|nr:vanadium-dependent haloperoxidase [Cyclobacteriaceae bacterium]
MNKILFAVTGFLLLGNMFGCNPPKQKRDLQPEFMYSVMQELTDVIVHDIFSPPVASRIYAYPSIAAYEIMQWEDDDCLSLAGQLNGLEALAKPEFEISYPLAATHAMYLVGKNLVFSEQKLEGWYTPRFEDIRRNSGLTKKKFNNSIQYAEDVAEHILNWADGDNYKQTRTMAKHSLSEFPHHWEPTPPAYMEAIEPNWNKIRPFTLKELESFSPAPPPPFSLEKGSDFMQEVMKVYEAVNQRTKEQAEIAAFWDCNPYVMNITGHVMYATKKITPGGHWMDIVTTACKIDSSGFLKTAKAYALTSIALADAFIVCWDEKFRSNLIRPETFINRYLDEKWVPVLQTPPFPEHTSGHSVISSAAAVILTDIFGEDFPFIDSTEVKYGLPPRKFESFLAAAEEAAISRLYGGIHYMPAITEGVKQGKSVGNYIIGHLKLENDLMSVADSE